MTALLVALAAAYAVGLVMCLLAIGEHLMRPAVREPVMLAVGCFFAVLLSGSLWLTWLTWAALEAK